MGGTLLGILAALTLAAPPPPPKTAAPPAEVDRALAAESEMFARTLIDLAQKVAADYARPVTVPDLLAAGLDAAFEAVGRKVPPEFRERLSTETGFNDSLVTLSEARTALGRHDQVLERLRAQGVLAAGLPQDARAYRPSPLARPARSQDLLAAERGDR